MNREPEIARSQSEELNEPSQLHVRLLGDFQLTFAGETISALNAERPRSLLAYLLLHRTAPQLRQQIAFLLWPDSNEEQALGNLRNMLHKLRRAIPNAEAFLAIDNLTIQWRAQAPYTLDVAEFEEAFAQAQQATDQNEARFWLEKALTSYGGDLVPGSYDDWIISLREELRRQLIEALHMLIEMLEQQDEYRLALRFAQRLLQQDVLDESVYIMQMRLCALGGYRAGIRRIYQGCVDVLARELDVAPSSATQEAYEQFLRLEQPAPAAQTIGVNLSLDSREPVASSSIQATHIDAAHAGATTEMTSVAQLRARLLPTSRTPFVGRKRELAELAVRFAHSECRLLTIIGPGGVGKTRLALETARGHQPVFADAVVWVPLAPLESADQIVPAIADALNIPFQGAEPLDEQLIHHLGEKHTLLLLDNFEHVLDGAELLSTILDETDAVKLLVTSRERLNLQEEWVFELGGLPTYPEQAEVGEENDATTLFVQSARRVRQDFTPSPEDEVAIRHLCDLVAGMPLSIELAATWVRLLSCSEIVQEIERNLDFLSTSLRNVPERHRSLRAVFDQSWAMLTGEEQAVFRRLACFRGGFTRVAGEQVAGATLPILSALVDKSLLQQTGTGRFGLHQLLRNYATEHLREADETVDIQNRHLGYFVTYAEDGGPTYVREPAWLERIAAEYENLWSALQWSTSGGNIEDGLRMAFSLHVYWEMRGYWREEYEWLTRLLTLPVAGSPTLIRARVLTHAGKSALHIVDSTRSAAYYEESLAIARQHHSVPDIVMALIGLGDSQQDHAAAQALYAESLVLSRESGFQEGAARALTCLGHLASGAGDIAGATDLYQEALAIQQELGDRLGATGLLRDLGIAAFAQQEYQQAQAIYEECLQTYRELGDQPGVMALLNDLADVALVYGDYARATEMYGESLSRAYELGSKWNMAWNFERLATVATQEGHYERAAYLFGIADHLFQLISVRRRLDDMAEHERIVALARDNLCEQTFLSNWQQGQNAPLEQAITFALHACHREDTLPNLPIPTNKRRQNG